MEVKVNAYAKINLLLDIVAKRRDNYHDLFMIMQSVDIYDTVILNTNSAGKITIQCDRAGIPCDGTNIAYKAAQTFFGSAEIEMPGLEIQIKKRIPHAAGLAGGSADGAAVLTGLNYLYSNYFTEAALCKIGAEIGADIPFCIMGGTLLSQGIGDVLSKVKPLPECYIVLAKPDCSVSTAYAYSQFDRYGKTHTPNCLEMLCAVQSGDLKAVAAHLENVFEQFIEVPHRIVIKEKLRKNGALGVCMSGSGPTIYGIFDDEQSALSAVKSLKSISDEVFITSPARCGCKIICT